MSKRAMAGAVVAVFAVGVAAIAVVAGRGGSGTPTLQKLPIGSASSRAAAQDSAGTTSAMLAPIRPVEYRVAPGLPTLGGTATAYKLSSAVDTGAVARLARALGLSGAVTTDPDSAMVTDGQHDLRVTKDASLPWSYGPHFSCAPDVAVASDGSKPPASSGGGCAVSGGTVSSGSAGSSGGASAGSASTEPGSISSAPPETTIPTRPGDLPSRDAAKAIAVKVAEGSGFDVTGADIRIDDGITQWQVNIDFVVDGHPVIGMPTSVAVGDKGAITYASGFLGKPTSLGDYPLVGTPKGIERLKAGFGVGPMPMMGAAESGVAKDTPAVSGGAPTQAPVTIEPSGGPGSGPTTSIAPLVRTITGVSLALTYVSDYSTAGHGTGYLVPAYLFTLDDGTTTSMVAVSDDLLATTTGTGPGATDVVPNGKR